MLFYTIFKILYTQMSSENNFYFYNQFYCNVPYVVDNERSASFCLS